MKSIVVYGDIHGCLDEFKALRAKANLKPNDIEISVGDFLNKGPLSLETLHYLRKHHIDAVMGNNEAKIIKLYKRYLKEGDSYLESLRAHEKETLLQITEEEINFLESLPYFKKYNGLTILHGGLLQGTKLDNNLDAKAKKQITLLRFLNRSLAPIPWDDFEGRYKFWSELYEGEEGFIVFGHHPFEQPKVDEYAVGIDTGCVYGGQLTAAKFKVKESGKVETKNYKLISVDAAKDYWN
ncbi:MAG: metallophosphoesterase [Epsilonproteobacteria bacterium]|nr:metallophosphoesterase [Campylobacterota bacterium]